MCRWEPYLWDLRWDVLIRECAFRWDVLYGPFIWDAVGVRWWYC